MPVHRSPKRASPKGQGGRSSIPPKPCVTEKGGGPLAQPHTQKQVAATSKAETVAAHQKAELEKKVAANLKAERAESG